MEASEENEAVHKKNLSKKMSENAKRFSDEQIKSLESIFKLGSKLEPSKKLQIARDLGLRPRQVAIWFQNKRARWKSKQLEQDYKVLKANYDDLYAQSESLMRENQSLQMQVKMGPLSVSPMGFGTWAWGNQLLWGYQESMDSELQQVFNVAVENGINLFDTADSYGTGKLNGQSEKLLGKFIREFEGNKQVQDNIVIATKFAAYPWRLTPGQFVNACKIMFQVFIGSDANSANRNRTITLVNCKLCSFARASSLGWFSGNGLVRAVGVSNYGPKQLLKIHNYLKARGVPLCSAQVQFSLLSMGKDQMEIKNICDSLGIRLISYSPLGLGMLTGKYSPSSLPSGPRGLLFRQILPGLEPLLNSLKEIAQKRRKTIPQVAINWCICKGTIPIPGVKSIKQAEENLGALGWQLTSDELLQLENGALESPRQMIQNIFQTS